MICSNRLSRCPEKTTKVCAMRTNKNSRVVASVIAAGFCFFVSAAVFAEDTATDYPNRVIRIIVGFTPGGAPDITARVLAPKLSEIWKQPVIVDNRPGAGSEIAARYVAGSAPDGYTLFSITNAHAVAPAISRHLPYDAVKDFTAITMTSIAPQWVLVSPQLGVKTLKDFVALAKSKPNQLNFGSAGVGSFMHFSEAMFDDAVGIKAQHVPYKGPPEALADTVAGRVQYVVAPIGAALGLVRAGKLVPLAVTGKQRLPEFPNVPTVAESGYPGFELLTWTGLLAPAHLPPAVLTKINRTVAKVLKEPDVQQRFKAISVEPIWTTPDAFQKRIADAVSQYTAAARKAGIVQN
jgi:tripartite-type tricarboxylate transporter receptor subunit TctC